MTTRMLEPLEAPLEKMITAALGSDAEILIRASTDLDANGLFGHQWVVASREVLLILSDMNGPSVRVPMEQILDSRTEPLVGGGRLLVERMGKPTLLLSYTDSQAAKFSEVARGLEQLRSGKPFLINAQFYRLRCEKCSCPQRVAQPRSIRACSCWVYWCWP